jgi:hypothetical protein
MRSTDDAVRRARERATRAWERAERETAISACARERIKQAKEQRESAPDEATKAAHHREVKTNERSVALHEDAMRAHQRAIALSEKYIAYLEERRHDQDDKPGQRECKYA